MKFMFYLIAISLIISCKKNNTDQIELCNETENPPKADRDTFYEKLANRWAPIHYQDVDPTGSHSLSGKSDYITAMDYDGDWNALNNWENLDTTHAKAVGYYTVIETATHWFLTVAFFHPRDWSDNWFTTGEHENDLEAIVEIIEKDGSEYGNLTGAITVFHSDFYLYKTPTSTLQDGADGSIQSTPISFQLGDDNKMHPKTGQEAEGHGLKIHPDVEIKSGDGIIYFPSITESEEPADIYDTHVKYKLINMFSQNEIWDQRFNSDFFESYTVIAGDNGSGSAQPPWGWDDHDDGSNNPIGEIATDPVKLVQNYFSNLGTFSTQYIYNPYQGID